MPNRQRPRVAWSLGGHAPIGGLWGLGAATVVTVAAATRLQDKPTGLTPTCVDAACHTGIVEHRVMHGPTAQLKCDACHVPVEPRDHRFALVAEPATLCARCHAVNQRTFVHEPVRQGDCTGCHDPHGSEHAMMLVGDPTQGLCETCHVQEDTPRFVHGPVASGACILCHEAHSSWEPDLLTERPRDLCLSCHEELIPDEGRDRYRHAPVEEGCLSCHDAHGSNVQFNLHAEAPGLCYGCHQPLADETRSEDAVVHGALTEPGGCSVCHSAHYASQPALQRRAEIDLCLDCHDHAMESPGHPPLTDMKGLLDNNAVHHGPIREGTCSPCHDPHVAPHARLLRKAYPASFYAPFDPKQYELCFECHITELVEEASGTGLTRFRHGDLNLHWLHVNRPKGRTCRACHEVHASENPFHIRDSVPFGEGGWALTIGFRQTASGGSCAPGCHTEKAYDRELEAMHE